MVGSLKDEGTLDNGDENTSLRVRGAGNRELYGKNWDSRLDSAEPQTLTFASLHYQLEGAHQ